VCVCVCVRACVFVHAPVSVGLDFRVQVPGFRV